MVDLLIGLLVLLISIGCVVCMVTFIVIGCCVAIDWLRRRKPNNDGGQS